MAKITSHYVCKKCGRVEETLHKICPICGSSDSFERCIVNNDGGGKTFERRQRAFPSGGVSEPLKRLDEVEVKESIRYSTGLSELDRVLGGGIMKGSSILLGGEPGIGKSTLMLQAIANISKEHSVVYVSGEETDMQVKIRSDRLGLDASSISLFSSTKLASIIDMLWRERPSVVVIDSLQTLSTSDLDSAPGTQSQIKACTAALTETVKMLGITMFIIAHINKDGGIAGPKFAEHLVDTVMYFESAEGLLRVVRTSKNRYGSSDEVGVFMMSEKGLSCIDDISKAFAVERVGNIPMGIVNTVVQEGTRAIFMEIQVLCTPLKGANRRIYSDKIDVSVVQRVTAVLEGHLGINLSQNDIYVNVAGGLRLTDRALELALAVALFTSYNGIELKRKAAFYGELTLRGEVRKVPFLSKREKCAESMGFSISVSPEDENSEEDESGITHYKLDKLENLFDVINRINE